MDHQQKMVKWKNAGGIPGNYPADPQRYENGKATLRAGDPRISEGDGQGNPVPGRWWLALFW